MRSWNIGYGDIIFNNRFQFGFRCQPIVDRNDRINLLQIHSQLVKLHSTFGSDNQGTIVDPDDDRSNFIITISINIRLNLT
jgi:hypothetical protein